MDLLQQWGARRPEVSFYLRHCPAWPQGTPKTKHVHVDLSKPLLRETDLKVGFKETVQEKQKKQNSNPV